MGIFNKKKKIEPQRNSIDQPLDHLINGKLPFGWVYHFKEWYKPRDHHLTSIASKLCETTTKEQRILIIKELIEYFYSYKSECENKGECYAKYFDEMWMHCKNNKCDDFIYISPYEEELKFLEKESDRLCL